MPVSFTEDDTTKTEPLTQGTAAPSEKTPLTAREERLARAEARPSSIGKMERKSTLGYGQFGFNQRHERKGSLSSEKSKCVAHSAQPHERTVSLALPLLSPKKARPS